MCVCIYIYNFSWLNSIPSDSQESSPTPQFKSINSLTFILLYSPTLTSKHDYWKNHRNFIGKVMSLLFNTLSRLVITFLARSKSLHIWNNFYQKALIKSDFSLSSFTLIKRTFSSSLLAAIRVVSSAYPRLLIFLLEILIPACASSSLAFLMMYSTYKWNKKGDNMQPWRTPFLIWN